MKKSNAGFAYHTIWIFVGLLLMAVSLFCGCRKEEAVFVAEEFPVPTEAAQPEELPETESDQVIVEKASLTVYVCGQVVNPDVYELEPGARIADALACAGGMTPDAASEVINLAELLEDGQMIRVPSLEEVESGWMADSGLQEEEPGKVSLNLATKEQLMTLPGIGESKADAILQYRSDRGRFGSIEEIMNIPGIKDGVFSKIKDKIRV